MLERIEKTLKERDDLTKEILEIIGYGSGDNSYIDMDFIDRKWDINGEELYLETDDDDYYQYTISSYSAKGEKLFMGEKDDLTFVMGYCSEDSYSDTTLFILKNENRDSSLAQ